MEDKNVFRLINIILIESIFKRAEIVNPQDANFSSKIDIDLNDTEAEGQLYVLVTLTYAAGSEEAPNQINATVKMLGHFQCPEIGDSKLSIKTFKNLNAPAIIFPFVREHLASVSIKAGIAPILLPPVNFVKYAEENKKEK